MIEEPVEMELSGTAAAATGEAPGRVAGRMDRMDIDTDGGARILDYKLTDLGTLKGRKKKIGMTEFQLMIYALAATATEKPDGKIDLAYLSFRHAAREAKIWSGTRRELAELFQPGPILNRVRSGQFDVTPEDESLCDRCDFRRACRIRDVLSAEQSEDEPQ